MKYSEMLVEHVKKRLDQLTWRCNCPQVHICEDQAEHGEPRYCWPIICAAIMEEEEWETSFREKEEKDG